MPCFICAKCGSIENTALGLWWSRHDWDMYTWPDGMDEFKGKGLCSECAPEKYNDGTATKYGKWHGRFEREHYSKVEYEGLLNERDFA